MSFQEGVISAKELKELLHYDSDTGIFTWKVSNGNRINIGDVSGSISKIDGYIRIKINGKMYLAHRLAWLYEYGYFPENDLDHKDRIKHHNWIKNLRETSDVCNQRNTGNPKNNTSGVKGICWAEQNNKWKAQIVIDRKTKGLGYYSDFLEAVCHRLAAEQCVNWEGCDSSSPAYQYVNKKERVLMSKYYKPKNHVCPYCKKDFKKSRQLKSHLKDAHHQELESLSVIGLSGSEAGIKLKESLISLKNTHEDEASVILSKGSVKVSKDTREKFGDDFLNELNK